VRKALPLELDVALDSEAPPGDFVPALARLLRRLRDNTGLPTGGQHPAAADSRVSLPGSGGGVEDEELPAVKHPRRRGQQRR
jgi:hypothetical protein